MEFRRVLFRSDPLTVDQPLPVALVGQEWDANRVGELDVDISAEPVMAPEV